MTCANVPDRRRFVAQDSYTGAILGADRTEVRLTLPRPGPNRKLNFDLPEGALRLMPNLTHAVHVCTEPHAVNHTGGAT